MIVFGFAPIVYLGLKDVEDERIDECSSPGCSQSARLGLGHAGESFSADAWTGAWWPIFVAHRKIQWIDWMAMVFGLGFVLPSGTGAQTSGHTTRIGARNMMIPGARH